LSSERPVSILQLLAQPEQFHGARVQVVGFVSVEREATAVYLHKEDFLQGLTPNAIWLDLEGAKVSVPQKSGYTIVEGRFDPTQHGHMGLFAGGIDQIDRLTPMPSRVEFAPPPRVPTFEAGPLPSAMPRKWLTMPARQIGTQSDGATLVARKTESPDQNPKSKFSLLV
jgi:hypothetical protein